MLIHTFGFGQRLRRPLLRTAREPRVCRLWGLHASAVSSLAQGSGCRTPPPSLSKKPLPPPLLPPARRQALETPEQKAMREKGYAAALAAYK